MAIATIRFDLAPPDNLWRRQHRALSLAALGAGALVLAAGLWCVGRTRAQAEAAGQRSLRLAAETARRAELQRQALAELRGIDVAKELPHWRLAEKILTERSLPWSRLTAELERSLVDGVRLKSVQRTRSSDLKVQLKLKGEARTRAAEAGFVESLRRQAFFETVLLEREGLREGGGVEFECTLAAPAIPPAFVPLPGRSRR
jgi:Tfp pilus assembly protein PilN